MAIYILDLFKSDISQEQALGIYKTFKKDYLVNKGTEELLNTLEVKKLFKNYKNIQIEDYSVFANWANLHEDYFNSEKQKELLRAEGVFAYWEKAGPPVHCRKISNEDAMLDFYCDYNYAWQIGD